MYILEKVDNPQDTTVADTIGLYSTLSETLDALEAIGGKIHHKLSMNTTLCVIPNTSATVTITTLEKGRLFVVDPTSKSALARWNCTVKEIKKDKALCCFSNDENDVDNQAWVPTSELITLELYRHLRKGV